MRVAVEPIERLLPAKLKSEPIVNHYWFRRNIFTEEKAPSGELS